MLHNGTQRQQIVVTRADPPTYFAAQPKRWFALRVRPRHEKKVAQVLRQRGLEEFLPLYQVRRRWSDRYKLVDLPLFPTYLFGRFCEGEHGAAIRVPGVRSIVGWMNGPEPVDDREIEGVRTVISSGLMASPCGAIREGQRVRVHDGPLFGCEGVLERAKGSCRLVIAVSLLRRAVAVEVDQRWVTPIATQPQTEVGPRSRRAPRFGLGSRGRVIATS